MLRATALRVPVAIVAAGTLLCGCAAAHSIDAGVATQAPSTAPTVTAPPATTPSAAGLPVLVLPGPRDARSAARAPKPAWNGKTIYLTFDDGPSARYTNQILSLLAQYDAKATFFVIGRQVGHSKATLRAEYAAGHGVANHTWDHRSLRTMSKKKFRSEVGRTQRAIKAATGRAPVCLRPPGGAIDKHTRKWAKRYRLKVERWTVDPHDWKHPGAKKIATRVIRSAHDKSVVLLHDGGGNRAQTVAALRVVLADLSAKGYRFAAMCR